MLAGSSSAVGQVSDPCVLPFVLFRNLSCASPAQVQGQYLVFLGCHRVALCEHVLPLEDLPMSMVWNLRYLVMLCCLSPMFAGGESLAWTMC